MQFDPFLKPRKIKDVMSSSTLSLESTATASDAAKIMETRNLEAVVVIENKKLVGIITDRDYTIKLGSHAYPIDTPIHMPASQCRENGYHNLGAPVSGTAGKNIK